MLYELGFSTYYGNKIDLQEFDYVYQTIGRILIQEILLMFVFLQTSLSA